jgi:putative transcriptional regulator
MLKNKVFEMMVKRGYRTRREVAEILGMTEGNFGRIVNGDIKAIRLDTMDALCKLLNCQPGDLFEYSPDDKAA